MITRKDLEDLLESQQRLINENSKITQLNQLRNWLIIQLERHGVSELTDHSTRTNTKIEDAYTQYLVQELIEVASNAKVQAFRESYVGAQLT